MQLAANSVELTFHVLIAADSCRSRPQFLDDLAPRNGMMPPPASEMISPPITE